MSNILIIDGHQVTGVADGSLSIGLSNEAAEYLSARHNVKLSRIAQGYHVQSEQMHFLWADIIIYQYPIFWFSAPAYLQEYMQQVFEYGMFFEGDTNGYGSGGKLGGRKYMLSTTWNSPTESFGSSFWNIEKTPDDVLTAMHHAQKYIGLEKLPSFSCHNVVKHPQLAEYKQNLRTHLQNLGL